MCVVVEDSGAVLHVGSGPGELSMSLSRLQGPEAAAQLKELLFRMADSLAQTPDGKSTFVAGSRFSYQDAAWYECVH